MSFVQATIVLAANVAFMAVPNFDPNNSASISIYQVPSVLSTIASLGSILMSLILIRQHRTKAKETAGEAVSKLRRGLNRSDISGSQAKYLLRWTNPTLGLEILAI